MTCLELINELLSRFGLKEVASLGQTTDATTALRQINLAQQVISTAHPFVWAEKTTPGSITAADGTATYDLASDVAHLITAKHTYNGGDWIKVLDRGTLERYRSDRSQSSDRNTPRFMVTAGVTQAAVTDTPVLRAELWPVPGADFDAQTISYYYTMKLADMSDASAISMIPTDFHWLMVEYAETLRRRGPIRVGGDVPTQIDLFSIADNKFKDGLKALISRDSALSSSGMTWEADEPSL